MSSEEKNKLESISEASLYSAGVMPAAITHCFRILQRHIKGNNLLEMGPAEGVMTELLVGADSGLTVTLVEGSLAFCKSLQQRFPKVHVVHALFEEFEPVERYDNIVMGHVLEHVQDPVAILRKAKSWLTPGTGRLFAAVPNARSLHRQAAVIMEMLPHEDALNDLDRHHGHRRVFTPESFRNAFYQAGLDIEVFGGYWLKPISNKQIEEGWTPEMLGAFMKLGERYPDIAGEIYVIASNPAAMPSGQA